MRIRRSSLLAILSASLAVAISQKWTAWSKVAVVAAATAVLIDAGVEIAGWIKAEEEE